MHCLLQYSLFSVHYYQIIYGMKLPPRNPEVQGGGGYGREGLVVHAQCGAHKRQCVATAEVLLFRGGGGCGAWPPCQAKRAVCRAQRAKGYGGGGGGLRADYLLNTIMHI